MAPAISVIVPVFNTEKYLPMCLDSVLSQSMSDFEIIAVNDASTDNSPEILAGYAAKDPRVRIVNHEINRGLLAGRLSGIKAAKAKYTMFLDSDDRFLPGILQAALDLAEKTDADIVEFSSEVRLHSETGQEKLIKFFRPYGQALHGKEVFRKYFAENACKWALFQKLFRTELCRKTVEYIPDHFCLMAEDFCFYTICSFFAEHYEPLDKNGYVYFMDSGISSFLEKTEINRFLERQSPFQAFRNVRNFLHCQNAWDEYADAFAEKEQIILADYVFRWMRHLSDADRAKAFGIMFSRYDAFPLFLAFRQFFSDKDESILEMLTGENAAPAGPPVAGKVGEHLSLREQQISAARWQELVSLIRTNRFDTVILELEDNAERLLWDISAVKSVGAAAVCRMSGHCFQTLDNKGLKHWLEEDRLLHQASAVLVPDEKSTAWYQSRNCYAGISLDSLQPPRWNPETSAMLSALEKSEQNNAYYRIDPSDDGETFVPFFRKLDHVFRKIPDGFRKTTFRGLAAIYNHIRRK